MHTKINDATVSGIDLVFFNNHASRKITRVCTGTLKIDIESFRFYCILPRYKVLTYNGELPWQRILGWLYLH